MRVREMSDIKKILNTVKYMTPRQWKYRIYYTVRNKLMKRKLCKVPENIGVRLLPLDYKNYVIGNTAISEANLIMDNSFPTISGIRKSFEEEIDWDLKNDSYRLVCFRLNSFKYLMTLSDAYKETGDENYIKKGFELIDRWWESNSTIICGDKWNPYVIAERLMNWIGFCSEFCVLNQNDIQVYAAMIYKQAYELKKSVEYQLGANHLLSEGKALLVAGAFLRNRELYVCGKALLASEYNIQFLKDGGHYERSVSYHIESLQQYFEAITVMHEVEDEDYRQFIRMVRPAYQYLNGMIDVAGNIPLFNDAAEDYPFENASGFLATSVCLYDTMPQNMVENIYFQRWHWEEAIKEVIEWDPKELFKETGYLHHQFMVGKEKYSFFFDVGDGGPDSNLGHAHADALGILLSNAKKAILVDSGVYTYNPGVERNECRSTKAHNTIEVDECNSSEIWSAFRVAKRGHSKIKRYVNNNVLMITAAHDGYCKCLSSPVVHERSITINEGIIEINDSLKGLRKHRGIARFHIGADCCVKSLNANEYMIDNILVWCSESIHMVEYEYAHKFGSKEKSVCLEIPFTFVKEKTIKTVLKIIAEENGK